MSNTNDNIGTRIMNTVSAYNPFASGVDERIRTIWPGTISAFTNFRTGVSNRIDTVRSWTGGPNIPSHGEGVNGRIETQASYNTIDGATSSSPSYEAGSRVETRRPGPNPEIQGLYGGVTGVRRPSN
jgi:hypothetical protein